MFIQKLSIDKEYLAKYTIKCNSKLDNEDETKKSESVKEDKKAAVVEDLNTKKASEQGLIC